MTLTTACDRLTPPQSQIQVRSNEDRDCRLKVKEGEGEGGHSDISFNFTESNKTQSDERLWARPRLLPEQVPLASSSLPPQSFVPSQSHLLGMQRLSLHLK